MPDLELLVEDWDTYSGNDFMGKMKLNLAHLAHKRRVRGWYALVPQRKLKLTAKEEKILSHKREQLEKKKKKRANAAANAAFKNVAGDGGSSWFGAKKGGEAEALEDDDGEEDDLEELALRAPLGEVCGRR